MSSNEDRQEDPNTLRSRAGGANSANETNRQSDGSVDSGHLREKDQENQGESSGDEEKQDSTPAP
jgi:hypothetical protein